MAKAEVAQNVFKSLLKELGASITEETGEGLVTLKSEEWKFALNVHGGEDGKFEKAVLEKPGEGEECCKKFEAVVDALSELLKAFPSTDDKPEETNAKPEEEAKEHEQEAKEPEAKEEKSDENKENEAKEEQPSDA